MTVWKIVGNCPNCGGPVYVRNDDHYLTSEEPPPNYYSCECRNNKVIPKVQRFPHRKDDIIRKILSSGLTWEIDPDHGCIDLNKYKDHNLWETVVEWIKGEPSLARGLSRLPRTRESFFKLLHDDRT